MTAAVSSDVELPVSASPRQLGKRRSDGAHEPRTPPSLRALAKRLDFSPVASPNRRPVTAQPYHEALASAAGAAARQALSIKAAVTAAQAIHPSLLSTAFKLQIAAQPLPAPAMQAIKLPIRKEGTKEKAVTRSKGAKASQLAFKADLKTLHPALESCAEVLIAAGVNDLDTLRSLSPAELEDFLSLVTGLSMLQRALLKSRACKRD